jgi:hypothetical protein
MARIATTQRPPIVATLGMFAFAVLLGPRPVGPIEPEPMGPTPKCIVAGERHGELYFPDHGWMSQMPTVVPLGHWTMPILPPGVPLPGDTIDVDTLVSGLKRLLVTPRT